MTLIGGSRRQVRVNRVGFAVSRFTPDSRPSSEGSASPKRAKLQTYNLADDAAGESKRLTMAWRSAARRSGTFLHGTAAAYRRPGANLRPPRWRCPPTLDHFK